MKSLREIYVILMMLLVFASAIYVIPAIATANSDEEIPSEWVGKRKVVDRLGKYTRIAIIHYAVDIGDPDSDEAADGYALLGVWWNLSKYKSGVLYIVNPSGGVKQGLKESLIISEIKMALEVWDYAIDLDDYNPPDIQKYNIELFNNNTQINYKAKASLSQPDYRNVITWGRAQPGVVAYTIIWSISLTGEIVDTDIVLNSYYKWGIADGNENTKDLTGKFDIRNIVIHEAGHMVGLDDLYDSKYWAMSMYGYASYGEEIKRSLEPGDKAGAQTIYSAYR